MFTSKSREEVAMKALNLRASRYLRRGRNLRSQYGVLAEAIVQEVEKAKAEEKLRQYKMAIEGSDDLMAGCDKRYNYLFANKAYLDFYGLAEEGLVGRKLSEILGEGIFEKEVKPRVDRCLKGEIVRYGMIRTHPEKGDRDLEITYYPLKKEKEIHGAVAVMRDVTEQKEAEGREEFLHSLLRHDVRNKAQIVQGYLELLKDADLSGEEGRYVEKAVKANRECVDPVEKVRTLRKVREKEIGRVGIAHIIKDVITESETQASEKGIEVEFKNCKFEVQGGPLLEELFSNLVENSVQHSGGKKIRISGQVRDEECIVTVEDGGKGIADEDKEGVFDKGFKKGKAAGSGLGLTLVKEIAESYGGNIEVKDSELGGARFDVHL